VLASRTDPTDVSALPTGTRTAGALGLALAAVLLITVLSVAIGSNLLNPAQVWHGILGQGTETTDVVRGTRVPRTVLGLLVGAALGLAGAIMQSTARNPLADPGLLGVNAGAAAAVVSAISFLGIDQPAGYLWFALLGAAAASVVVYLLGTTGRSAATPVRMALAGTAIGAALSAYVTGVILIDPSAYYHFRYWDIGALTGRTLHDVGPLGWFLLAGLVAGAALCRPLNALALGEDVGRSLGAHVGRTRFLSVLAVTLLCGTATAAVGPIGFVGLAVPHAARMMVGVDHRRLLPMSALLGACMLLGADVVGRLIAWPQEIGAGLITAVVGAPVLIYLVRRKKLGRL
jgi:iron complex transport system permease protein